MSKVVDYYFTLNSPWTYLGSARLAEIAQRRGAEVRVKPMRIGEVFSQTGGLPLPKRAPARQAYRLQELARWRDRLGIPINFAPKFFPAPDEIATCVVLAAAQAGGRPLELATAIGKAQWEEDRNFGDENTLAEILQETGHQHLDLLAKARDPEMAALYDSYTAEALERGVFGSPTYIYEDMILWGQDRLDFLDRALAGE